jgi:acyl-CoA thioester hydrolase
MSSEFEVVRRVEFHETDAAGIVHFSNFLRYMEYAEHAFVRSLGFSIHGTSLGAQVGFPRVHAACDYRLPFRFEDQVRIHLLVEEVRRQSIRYAFRFGLDGVEPAWRATGRLVVACVEKGADGLRARPLPDALRAVLRAVEPERLEGCLREAGARVRA